MSKETDDLVAEIHENVRKDRKILREYCDAITKIADVAGDPLAKAGLAEQVARLADGLTRANAQLVELAKILVKKELVKKPGQGVDESEVDGLFDEIGDGMEREKEDDNN